MLAERGRPRLKLGSALLKTAVRNVALRAAVAKRVLRLAAERGEAARIAYAALYPMQQDQYHRWLMERFAVTPDEQEKIIVAHLRARLKADPGMGKAVRGEPSK